MQRGSYKRVPTASDLLFVAVIFASGVEEVSPIQVAAIQCRDQHLGSGDVGCHGNVVTVAGKQQCIILFRKGLIGARVTEKEENIDLIIGNTGCDLLFTALLSCKHTLDIQAGCL